MEGPCVYNAVAQPAASLVYMSLSPETRVEEEEEEDAQVRLSLPVPEASLWSATGCPLHTISAPVFQSLRTCLLGNPPLMSLTGGRLLNGRGSFEKKKGGRGN